MRESLDGYKEPVFVGQEWMPHDSNIEVFLVANNLRIKLEELSLPKIFLGAGSFGLVQEAFFQDRKVAVKFLSTKRKSFPKYFEREIASMAQTNHPRIVKLIGALVDPPAIVMEHVSGGTLKDFLQNQKKPLPIEEVLRLSSQIAEGLSHFHSRNLIHRDVTTSNILLDENKDIKIVDLGLCRNLDSEMTKEGVTNPRYRAPELVRDEVHYSNKVDVFSFGLVMSEIINLEKPFKENSSLNAAIKYYEGLRPNLQSDNQLLCNLVQSCWDHDPLKRPSFSEILDKIEKIRAQRNTKRRALTQLTHVPQITSFFGPPVPSKVESFEWMPPAKEGPRPLDMI